MAVNIPCVEKFDPSGEPPVAGVKWNRWGKTKVVTLTGLALCGVSIFVRFLKAPAGGGISLHMLG